MNCVTKLAARTCAWVVASKGWIGMSPRSTPSFRRRDLHLGKTSFAFSMDGPTTPEFTQKETRLSSTAGSNLIGPEILPCRLDELVIEIEEPLVGLLPLLRLLRSGSRN